MNYVYDDAGNIDMYSVLDKYFHRDPYSGKEFPEGGQLRYIWAVHNPGSEWRTKPWTYNPWTSLPRTPQEIKSDPFLKLYRGPFQPPEECMQMKKAMLQAKGLWDEQHNCSCAETACKNTEPADKPDVVNHPPHYKQGGIECIDAIQAALTPEEFRGYCKGNALKYVWREQHKGGVESLQKATWYLNRLNRAGQ